MGQGLGRLARSRRVQLTPIPQADGKQCGWMCHLKAVRLWASVGVLACLVGFCSSCQARAILTQPQSRSHPPWSYFALTPIRFADAECHIFFTQHAFINVTPSEPPHALLLVK